MFHKKVAKREAPDKTLFTVYRLDKNYRYPDLTNGVKKAKDQKAIITTPTTPLSSELGKIRRERWPKDHVIFVSFDPGTVNPALRIERRFFTGQVEPLIFVRFNFRRESALPEGEPDNVDVIYSHLIQTFKAYLPYFFASHVFICERQLQINYRSTRSSALILSFWIEHMADSPLYPIVVEIDSKVKYQKLGAPPRLNDNERKDWSVEYARKVLPLRGDTKSVEVMDHYLKVEKRKVDDLAETFTQIEGFLVCVDDLYEL